MPPKIDPSKKVLKSLSETLLFSLYIEILLPLETLKDSQYLKVKVLNHYLQI